MFGFQRLQNVDLARYNQMDLNDDIDMIVFQGCHVFIKEVKSVKPASKMFTISICELLSNVDLSVPCLEPDYFPCGGY